MPHGLDGAANAVHEVLGGGVDGNVGQGNGGHARLTWTNVMSGFILHHFSDLVWQGVKTDRASRKCISMLLPGTCRILPMLRSRGHRCTTICANGGQGGRKYPG
jgi:hypothetical protein